MGRILTLIVGAAIGAGAALLYSPNTGTRNRELVAEKLGGTFDQVQQLIKDPDAADDAKDQIEDLFEGEAPAADEKQD